MKRSKLAFWGFVGPSLFAFSLVVIIPLLVGIYYSFTDWNGIRSQVNFVGLTNYLDIFKDEGFVQAFIFTTKFTIASVISINIMGFSLALLVTRKLKISNALRTIFFMPNLIGGLILGFIWQFIFTKGFATLGELTGQRWLLGWLSNQETGFWGMVILMAWQMSGYLMVIYVAAIQNIPKELVEAAQIDGANAWERTKHIIFPLVRPAFTVSLFLTLSNSFKLYDQNLSLTGGGPANSTQMIAMNIYNTAFKFNEMGVAQAKAVVFFLVIGVITISQVYITKKSEVEM
ncbi:carbohydrate ABC transporter membrane protein 1 (CUT1 family) [Orenia metallireducens]|jgi:raffinose/stachyose/melibiose transport system permease protein|uniref:Carbohydrate ABC transporter membrane protein 1, CUT1 family n=1 Tax=Orenia metallireducens TaxID=1413210 RepID=A0A285I7R8_9FIRM|nr:sugar ABC transporter permease [Orenia metallireducens]PRX22384.1 carbohydrate ABC transporter membrane protein 1 (CUT1 family) [Orenia metallireducens]SNY44009.1 carbohydrate ABC transporter membrane protein 1, CUT1 family [Orenia metallireducens]